MPNKRIQTDFRKRATPACSAADARRSATVLFKAAASRS
jgi:hypothetical protein